MLRRFSRARPEWVCALTLVLISALPASAFARVRIGGPRSQVVAGAIPFAAQGVGAGARRVVFLIDGRPRWTARTQPFRFGHNGLFDTRSLRNGGHVLTIRVYYRGRGVGIARESIVVSNPRQPAASTARGAASGAVSAVSAPAGGVGGASAGGSAGSSGGGSGGTSGGGSGGTSGGGSGGTSGGGSGGTSGGGSGGTSGGTSGGGSGGASVALFNRETYSYSSLLSYAQEAQRYQVIVLQGTDYSLVPLLKAANPNLRILLYQHTWFSKPGDPAGWTVCTSYPSDLANDPSWFLRDASGNLIPTQGPGNYLMDPANPSYQQACFAHAIALAKQYGFDGIFMDDIPASPVWDMPVGEPLPPEYPTIAAWQAAMSNMLVNAAAAFHAQGLLAFANLAGTSITNGLWQTWSAPLDGTEEEAWTGESSGLLDGVWAWPTQLADLAWNEAHGKYTILHSYDTTEAGNTYGLASMMLAAGGLTSYSTSNGNYTDYETWYPEYTTAQQLGAPLGAYFELANGVYERAFANGIVLVNPTAQSVGTFSLGGQVYSGSGLTNATTISMGPTSGYILLQGG